MTAAAQAQNTTSVLYLGIELGKASWKIAFATGMGDKPRFKTVTPNDREGLVEAMSWAAGKLGLREGFAVKSLYEAGRDGFWVHRFLQELEIENLVVDSSSIEVNRRRRQAKTDRLDAQRLLRLLMRQEGGDQCLKVVRVPEEEEEDIRHFMRGRDALVRERSKIASRIKALGALHGATIDVAPGKTVNLDEVLDWKGAPLRPVLRLRLEQELERYAFLTGQIRELEKKFGELVKNDPRPAFVIARRLARIKGIGPVTSLTLSLELFSWRDLRNRRELAALVGLTPTPYSSGTLQRNGGISKAGNRRIRALLIEIGWGWLRFQPDHHATRWFQARFGDGRRIRRIGIVGVARRVLITLWRVSRSEDIPASEELRVAGRAA